MIERQAFASAARNRKGKVTLEEPALELLLLRFLNELVSLLAVGWDRLVNTVMREGGYVRYDGRKSTQILRDCERLLDGYPGSLTRLHEATADAANLEAGLIRQRHS